MKSVREMGPKEIVDEFAREVLRGCDACYMPLRAEIPRPMELGRKAERSAKNLLIDFGWATPQEREETKKS